MAERTTPAQPERTLATSLAPRRSLVECLWRGAIAGILAGVVMLLFSMVALRLAGPGFWAPFKLSAGWLLGEAAVARAGFDPGPVALGLVLFLLVAAALGALYGLIARGMPISPSLVIVGPIYGFVIWFVGVLFLWPRINPVLLKGWTDWVLFVGILLFGLVLGALYPIVRDTTAESPAPPAPPADTR